MSTDLIESQLEHLRGLRHEVNATNRAIAAEIKADVAAQDQGVPFQVVSEFAPAGDQPKAIEELIGGVNAGELARRQFREIARIAGLIFQGFPGAQQSVRHLQASSELFFDVFSEFDPENLLLDQARREVMSDQLEVRRLAGALDDAASMRIVLTEPERLTPLAFPLYAETLRTQHVSSEAWSKRIERMVSSLERAASTEESPPTPGRKPRRAAHASGRRSG